MEALSLAKTISQMSISADCRVMVGIEDVSDVVEVVGVSNQIAFPMSKSSSLSDWWLTALRLSCSK